MLFLIFYERWKRKKTYIQETHERRQHLLHRQCLGSATATWIAVAGIRSGNRVFAAPHGSGQGCGMSGRTQPLLVLSDVRKNFGGVTALKGLSVGGGAREVVGVIG